MELVSRRRQKNEDLRSLLTDIHRLVTLAHPGQHAQLADILAMNIFLTALGD